jgi:hypothetical protein
MFSITAFAFIPLVLLIRWKKENGLPAAKEDEENVHD